MKNKLAKRITSDGDLNDLGINGFELEDFVVAAAKKNHNNDINEAALYVINKWSEQYDESEAYDELVAVIERIGKRAWLKVLK